MRDMYVYICNHISLSLCAYGYHKFLEICYPSRNGAKLLHFPMVQMDFSDGPYGSMKSHAPSGYD